MATLSLRMGDDLKRKAQKLAKRQGVSLNYLINATVAGSVAQEETLTFFNDRLKDVDLNTLARRVLQFMEKTKPGSGPTGEQLREALGDQ
jgi:antitoxin component of RelBE/YafQ-DinJ toxin-antitoxin module